MTGAQAFINQGKQEGRKEGKLKGRQEGKRETLLEQLEVKFGPLAPATIETLKSLPESRITLLTRQILTANSLAELDL